MIIISISKDIIPRLKSFKYDHYKPGEPQNILYDVLFKTYIKDYTKEDKDENFKKFIKISRDITNATPQGRKNLL